MASIVFWIGQLSIVSLLNKYELYNKYGNPVNRYEKKIDKSEQYYWGSFLVILDVSLRSTRLFAGGLQFLQETLPRCLSAALHFILSAIKNRNLAYNSMGFYCRWNTVQQISVGIYFQLDNELHDSTSVCMSLYIIWLAKRLYQYCLHR